MPDPARDRGWCGVLPTALFAVLSLTELRVRGQEPATEPEASPEPSAATPEPPAARPEPYVALRVGTVHPMVGPAIKDGVILMQGSRISAVGAAGSVQIPADAQVFEHPDAHAYPGLVDSLSQACVPSGGDGIADAGGEMVLALDLAEPRSRQLVERGVTTAYVSSRSAGVWRGQGVLLHLDADGPKPFPGHEKVGVHLRLAAGDGPSHPLARIDRLAGLGGEFDQLEAYQTALREHETKLAEYGKQLEAWLEWHRKKNGKTGGEAATAPGARPANAGGGEAPARSGEPGARGPRGRRGPGGGQGGENPAPGGAERRPPQDPAPQNPAPQNPSPQNPAPASPASPGAAPANQAPAAEEKPPERPQFPPAPPRDPAKDALLALREGKLALFVEVDRGEEVTRALEIARQHGVKRLVLEIATRAASEVAAITEAGLPVVVGGAELPPLAELGPNDERRSIAALLAERGVPLAIGSLSLERARNLASIAAEAVGAGVPAELALRALTIDAAELLGVARECGSLEAGKLADVVVTSAPLLSSESRVLRVISAGRSVHEAK